MEEEALDDSAWKVDAILERRDRIVDAVADFHGRTMDPELADGAATEIEALLGWFGTKYPIRNTLILHTGTEFNRPQWRQLAWQIAANKERLRAGIPLAAFSPTAAAQWVAAEIIGVDCAVKSPAGKDAVQFEFRAMTGINAGFSFKELFLPQALFVLSRDVGYNRRNRYDDNPLMFFGFRLAVKLVDGRIERFFCTNKLKASNRAMIRLRRRDVIMPEYDPDFNDDGTERTRFPIQYGCPEKFEHNCWECEFTTRRCIAAYK